VRGARDGELHIWLDDDDDDDAACTTRHQLVAYQWAANPAETPCNGARRSSSTGDSTAGGVAAANSGERSDRGRTDPVEAAQPTNQWMDLRPADMPHISRASCNAEPSGEAWECSRPPVTEQPAAGPQAVQPPAAVSGPCGAAAAPAAGGMLAVVDPLKASRLSSAAVHLLFPAAAGLAALPSQVALTFLVGPPGKVGRRTTLHLQP
jgi:hypothetical protein